MLFRACPEGEYEPGKTYYGGKANWVYTNALDCIVYTGGGLTSALCEVRLEGGAVEMTVVRVLTAEERCAEWTGVFVSDDGIQMWFRNGQLHREEDLPAIYDHGDQAWYRDGLRHRPPHSHLRNRRTKVVARWAAAQGGWPGGGFRNRRNAGMVLERRLYKIR